MRVCDSAAQPVLESGLPFGSHHTKRRDHESQTAVARVVAASAQGLAALRHRRRPHDGGRRDPEGHGLCDRRWLASAGRSLHCLRTDDRVRSARYVARPERQHDDDARHSDCRRARCSRANA